MAFQMLAIIGLSAWLGTWLDGHFHTKNPWFTIGLMLLGLFAAAVPGHPLAHQRILVAAAAAFCLLLRPEAERQIH